MASKGSEGSWRKEGAGAVRAQGGRKAAPGGQEAEEQSGVSRRVLIIGGVVGAVAILWLVLFLIAGGDFYQSVEEVQAAAPVQNARVGGRVAPDSLQQQGSTVTFTLEGESGTLLPVRFVGAYPERLGPYEQVVAEGSLGDSGTFEATNLLVKCPDKLLPEKITNQVLGGAGLERLLY